MVLSTLAYDGSSARLLRKISLLGLPYKVTLAATGILITKTDSLKNRLFRLTRIYDGLRVISYFIRCLPCGCIGINPATYVIAEGARSIIRRPEVGDKTQVIWKHALDYDTILKFMGTTGTDNNTAVFLDNFLPSTPTPFFLGRKRR